MTELINYSEFNTLTQCERRFVYQYVLNQEEGGERRGLNLGTLCHLWHSRWLTGQGATLPSEWSDDINVGGKPGEVRTLCLSDYDPALVTRAEWLAARFCAVYGESPPSSWTVISAEEWLTREFTWGTLVGRTDGFVEIDGQLYLIEVKTYGSKPGPLAYCQVSPQLGCYSLLAEEKFGKLPFGILYQGIYTYQWKPKKPTQAALIAEVEQGNPVWDWKNFPEGKQAWGRAAVDAHPGYEREPSESFQQEWPELGHEHLRTAETYLEAAVARRSYLLLGAEETDDFGTTYEGGDALRRALPSIGQQCRNCGFRPQCWADLGGVEEFEIEVEDDGEPV